MMIAVKLDRKQIKTRPESGKIYFTYSDIETIPEWPEGPLVEIIRGELYMVPSPNIAHERVASRLQQILRAYVEQNHIGEVFTAPVDIILSEENVVVPDIFFISREKAEIIKEQNIQGVPDFIIEILSQNKIRDLIDKKETYEENGVPEYWIVDPTQQTVLVYIFDPTRQQYKKEHLYSTGDTIPVKTVPNLKIPVSEIFQDL